MQQYQERNYAPKARKVEKGDLKQYSNRSEVGQKCQTSCCDSIQQSWRSEEEEIIPITPLELPLCLKEIVQQEVEWYISLSGISLTGEQGESLREEDVSKTHQERRQGVQEPDQGRCQAQEADHSQTKGEEMKKQTMKEKKHEAKETKAYERKEEKKEKSSKPEKKK